MRRSKEEREVREKETRNNETMKSEIFSQINVRKQATDLGSSENNNQDKCKNKQKKVFSNRHCT